MIKNGRVEIGRTPSEVSGKPSDKTRSGVPLTAKERLPSKTVEKLASKISVDIIGEKR